MNFSFHLLGHLGIFTQFKAPLLERVCDGHQRNLFFALIFAINFSLTAHRRHPPLHSSCGTTYAGEMSTWVSYDGFVDATYEVGDANNFSLVMSIHCSNRWLVLVLLSSEATLGDLTSVAAAVSGLLVCQFWR